MEDYNDLKFACLFHDIGKFYQRADNPGKSDYAYDSKYGKLDANDYGSTGAHSKWSADFVKNYFNETIESLVLYHHEPQNSCDINLANILQKSDQHSLNEIFESDDNQNILKTPLTSIFSKVSINGEIPKEHYVPLKEIDFNNDIYPKESKNEIIEGSDLAEQYKKLWKNFVNEFDKLKNKDFESCLALVKKYTVTMPASSNKSSNDISLYEHLKTTVAIANCRYLFSKETELLENDSQEVYRIINGDISGIQNFIYRVHSPEDAQKGMSKRLRGRSLYLSLLSEAICNKIILDLNLDSSNILFCGGGRFTIIAPNTCLTEKIINKIDSDVNDYFIHKFNAELYLALVSVQACGVDLNNFGNILTDLNILLDLNKKHKFKGKLDEIFEVMDDCNYELCSVCGNETNNEDKICDECRSHESLGQKVANAQYVVKYYFNEKIRGSEFFIDFLNCGFAFKKDKNDIIKMVNENPNIRFVIYRLNDTNFVDFSDNITNENVSFDFKVLANTIPNINGDTLYFEHLAKLSKGSNKLGILKMDVDNLGKIFSKGFDYLDDKEQGSSISRVSSLSFFMDFFFSGRINQLVSKFKFFENKSDDENFIRKELVFDNHGNNIIKEVFTPKNDVSDEYMNLGNSTIHINYSGGDDLLVIGPYDDIIDFAQEFRNNFKKWTADNDSINISAGILLTGPKFPIGKSASLAENELEKSKNLGKNKITIFNETIKWDNENLDVVKGFDELFNFSKFLEKNCENDKISKSFVFSLLNIWELNYNPNNVLNDEEWKIEMNRRVINRDYIHYFKYKLRLIKDDDLRKKIDKDGCKFMPWIKIPVSWVSLRLR